MEQMTKPSSTNFFLHMRLSANVFIMVLYLTKNVSSKALFFRNCSLTKYNNERSIDRTCLVLGYGS